MPYMCPECETVYERWPFLKGHLMKVHEHKELKDAKGEAFQDYLITPEEAQERKKKKAPEKKEITEIPTEPVERLDALLTVNGIDDEARQRCLDVFRLNPSWHYDPYQVEQLLVAQNATKRRELVLSIVKQYIGDLKAPPESQAGAFPQPGRAGASYYGAPGGVGGEYPGYPRRGPGGGEPVTYADLYRERETQKLEQQLQQLLNRTSELEKKLEEKNQQLLQRTVEQGERTMTIADERGNPMVVPFDPLFMDVLRREAEAKAKRAEREEMVSQMMGLGLGKTGGGTDTEIFKALMKPMEDRLKESTEQVAQLQQELRQQQQDQTKKQIEAAQEESKAAKMEAREAKEMAASAARGDKPLADYLAEAGTEAKDAVQKATKDLKEGLEQAGERIASIVTGKAPPAKREPPTSPAELAEIMQAEKDLLDALQQTPKGG